MIQIHHFTEKLFYSSLKTAMFVFTEITIKDNNKTILHVPTIHLYKCQLAVGVREPMPAQPPVAYGTSGESLNLCVCFSRLIYKMGPIVLLHGAVTGIKQP